MVFDDSFEHEVVHGGTADRFVLYAVLHHPDLGTPKLRVDADGAEARGSGSCDADGRDS